jgi:hypothetical protein
MRWLLPGALGLALAAAAGAHRLDECLQAVRIALGVGRLEVSIDLTPGVAVAERLLAVVDRDRDGRLSDDERAGYAQQVLQQVHVALDGRTLGLEVVDATYPTSGDMRRGVGVIAIRAAGQTGLLAAGPHALQLTNSHLPEISVYLVNALVPKDPAVTITKQTRDRLQREYRLEFDIAAGAAR